MLVSFVRSGPRRYGVRVQPAESPPLVMDPAPGFDEALPHDLGHYLVEEELGLELGVFGQLAAGGDAGTLHLEPPAEASRDWSRLHRKVQKRGERLGVKGRPDAELSERAAALCHSAWLARSSDPEHRREALAMRPFVTKIRNGCSDADREALSDAVVARICERLAEMSAVWSRLEVGQAIELEWTGPTVSHG